MKGKKPIFHIKHTHSIYLSPKKKINLPSRLNHNQSHPIKHEQQ